MIDIKLTRNKCFKWYHKEGIYVKGYLYDRQGNLYQHDNLINYFHDIENEISFKRKLLEANGIFSVIIQHIHKKELWISVDRFRYFPLFYRKKENDFLVSDDIDNLYATNEKIQIDQESAIFFSGISYVLGNKTLLKNIYQIQAGELLVCKKSEITRDFYHRHYPDQLIHITFEEAKIQLKSILRQVSKRMAGLIGNRPVILPLSGGLDSRLIAYMLKKEGIENILCYTFGKKEGNPEWVRSQKVAGKLGFKWIFIDYTAIHDPEFYKDSTFNEFYNYESQYVSKFGIMQYLAANHLTRELNVSPDSVVIPGHGGDFFSGSHLQPSMKNYRSVKTVAKDLVYSHCRLVQLSSKERKQIFQVIKGELINSIPLFSNIENWDLKERQAKYIVNSNKLWEYFGLETQMPLCDTELMDFFVALPFDLRLNQRLYKAVISELFDEFDINFPEDNKHIEVTFIQKLKVSVKRAFPFLRKKTDLFQSDYFDFKRISKGMVQEVWENMPFSRKPISLNGILSEWYLMQIRRKFPDEN
jgi:asparagine synthase (glutamine-hydrolysing)